MKQLKYNIAGKEVLISISNSGNVASVSADGQPLEPTAGEMAVYAGVIALALAQYEVEEVHDEETSVITLKHSVTPWNDPARQFNHSNQ